jgi:hypothetical protein
LLRLSGFKQHALLSSLQWPNPRKRAHYHHWQGKCMAAFVSFAESETTHLCAGSCGCVYKATRMLPAAIQHRSSDQPCDDVMVTLLQRCCCGQRIYTQTHTCARLLCTEASAMQDARLCKAAHA